MVKGFHIFSVYSLFIAHVPLKYPSFIRLPNEIRDADAFQYVDLLIKITLHFAIVSRGCCCRWNCRKFSHWLFWSGAEAERSCCPVPGASIGVLCEWHASHSSVALWLGCFRVSVSGVKSVRFRSGAGSTRPAARRSATPVAGTTARVTASLRSGTFVR